MKKSKKMFVNALACLLSFISLCLMPSCEQEGVAIPKSEGGYEYNGVKYVSNKYTESFSGFYISGEEGFTQVGYIQDGKLLGDPVYVYDLDVEQNVIFIDSISSSYADFYVKEGFDLSDILNIELAYISYYKSSEEILESGFKLKDFLSESPAEISNMPTFLQEKELRCSLAVCPYLYKYVKVYVGEGRIFLNTGDYDTEYYEVVDEGFKEVLMELGYAEN